jgi:transposase
VAAHQKKARRQGAHLVVIDESGLLMAPLVRRTWALRGQTPELAQRCRNREKVSVAAALWLSPLRDRLGLFARTLVDDYFDNWTSAAFLEALLQELHGRVVVVWDGGSMHKGDPIDQLKDLMADRLSLERFPAYAPELCPVEPLWSWLKYSQLCNYAPQDAIELDGRVIAELSVIRDDQDLLRSFFHASKLPLPRPLTLLS